MSSGRQRSVGERKKGEGAGEAKKFEKFPSRRRQTSATATLLVANTSSSLSLSLSLRKSTRDDDAGTTIKIQGKPFSRWANVSNSYSVEDTSTSLWVATMARGGRRERRRRRRKRMVRGRFLRTKCGRSYGARTFLDVRYTRCGNEITLIKRTWQKNPIYLVIFILRN